MKWDLCTDTKTKTRNVCCAKKFLKNIISLHAISSNYFTYFHDHLRYGFIFWVGDTESKSSLHCKKSLCKQSVM